MRIKALQLSGVGPFDDTTIEFPAGGNPALADVYLLVGQNGCGKTTALHALASMLMPIVGAHLGLGRRFTKIKAFGRVFSDGPERWAVHRRVGPVAEDEPGLYPFHDGFTGVDFYGPDPSPLLGLIEPKPWQYWYQAFNFPPSHSKLSWAAFAYAGARSVEAVEVNSITEISDPPLRDSLSFHQTADSQRLAQWVANQEYKRLKAQNLGLTDEALQIAESVTRIEDAVREITDSEFRFVSGVRDLNIRVQHNGAAVEFGLLPEGVKSIVSWVADLLMRMDRIPWVNDLPVHEREFLLLLDEIDVHLHPAWQRKLLPVVQRIFPKAQIIASTHSPFVVASLGDGAVIELRTDANGKAAAMPPIRAPLSMSYSTALRELFGIKSDFDIETERAFIAFQEIRNRVLRGEVEAQVELEHQADALKRRGDEVAQLVQFELNQLARARRPAGT